MKEVIQILPILPTGILSKSIKEGDLKYVQSKEEVLLTLEVRLQWMEEWMGSEQGNII